MAQAPPKKRQKLSHAVNHKERLQLLKALLHERTSLATVLQDIVLEFLREATTLFACDWSGRVVLAVDLDNNAVRVLAGEEDESGHVVGRGSEARFTVPHALAVDPASGTLFVCDGGLDGSCIRRVTPDGTVSTLCGNPNEQGYREGVGSAALFKYVHDACVIGKDLFVTDTKNHCIRRIPLDGSSTSLFAGSPGQPGCVNGVGTEARFRHPAGFCREGTDNLLVADQYNCTIRRVNPDGAVTTLIEKDPLDGRDKEARFDWPETIEYDAERKRVLVVESNKHRIQSIDLCSNRVSTMGVLKCPRFITVEHATGDVFLSTWGGLRRVSQTGSVLLDRAPSCPTAL